MIRQAIASGQQTVVPAQKGCSDAKPSKEIGLSLSLLISFGICEVQHTKHAIILIISMAGVTTRIIIYYISCVSSLSSLSSLSLLLQYILYMYDSIGYSRLVDIPRHLAVTKSAVRNAHMFDDVCLIPTIEI